MIELCTIPKELFKPVIDTLCDFKREVEFQLHSDKIAIETTDTANVALVSLHILSVPKEECKFQISLKSLEKVSSKKDDVIVYDDDPYVVFKIDGARFKIRKIDPRVSGIKPIPEIDIPYCATVDIDKDYIESVNAIFKVADNYTNNAVFQVTNHELVITADFGNEDTVEKPIEKPVDGKDCRSRIATEYLINAFANHKLYTNARVSMGTNVPLKFEFTGENINTTIVISPRNEDQDLDYEEKQKVKEQENS